MNNRPQRLVATASLFALLWLTVPACAQQPAVIPGIRAELRPVSYRVPLGRPALVRFILENTSDDPKTLTVPGTNPAIPSPQSGLPIEHIFSSGAKKGVSITTPTGRQWTEANGYRPSDEAPILMIAPHGSVGATLDLREYFPTLRGAGQYRVTWSPYGGALGSVSVVLNIAPLHRAEIITDAGSMTVRFFYREAPLHVANFIELAESGFYNNRLFHRLEPGYLIQGGCPRNDGTGIRLDGKRLQPEFNSQAMRKGTLAMALLDDDPDSASCQFFICNTRQKDWDGRYTIFGELVGDESFETLDRLMSTPVDDAGAPVDPINMRSVRIVDAPLDDLP